MSRSPKSVLAALLTAAILAAPGGALASAPAVAMSKPVETRPAPLPAPGGESEELVQPKLSRDEAIAIARGLFTIPAELGEPNVGIHQDRVSAVWSLTWQSSSKQPEQTRIEVRVDAVTGTLLRYSAWKGGQEEPLALSFTRSEAKARAEERFAELVPAEYREGLRYVESPLNASYWGGVRYQFNWVREVKGYPLAGNGVYITIDARSGEMTEYNLHWQRDVDPTLPETIITQAEAEEAYRSQVGLVLQYQRFTVRGTDKGEWRLVYRPVIDSFPRMNQEGQILGHDGKVLDLAALAKSQLVPAGDKPYQKPAQPLEQEEALQIARAATGRTDAPKNSSYSEYGEETKRSAWDFTWVIEGTEGSRRSEQRVRIDAETGLVTQLNHWTETPPFGKDEEVPVSLKQAQEIAIDFLRTHRPDLAGSLLLRENEQDPWMRENPDFKPTEYYIRFQQLKNGLPVMGRDLSISISARTGEIRNFWSAFWEEQEGEEFPNPKATLSAEQAMAVFFKHQGIEPGWFAFWSPNKGEVQKPTLVWQPGTRLHIQSIDAKTGAPLDWEGRNLIEAMRYPSDIKGHYAEREIELLWARGVFELQDGKFKPDLVISADELARWIVLTRGMRPYMAYDFAKLESAGAGRAALQAKTSANSAYFGAALQSGIILPEELAEIGDINGPVNREIFALWAARAMGYGRIAKMEARIAMNFADKDAVGAKYQNAVALLAGLGVVSGDADGNFGPQKWLTRADAAKILFAVSTGR
ncbi:MAG: YcdB/YcdC domain-containing protein [Bacillota bacterium]